MFSRLQYISQGDTANEQLQNIREALDAGCDWIQLRFKEADETELFSLAEKVRSLCSVYKATFIINDHPWIAKQVDADGVHLGLEDMTVAEAKKIVGEKVVGGTANTLAQVLQRVEEGCSYVGLGPLRFTATKKKLSPVLGIEGYTGIMRELSLMNISMPVYAIGGFVAEDIPAIMETGVFGIAVSGLITQCGDKMSLVKQLKESLTAGEINGLKAPVGAVLSK